MAPRSSPCSRGAFFVGPGARPGRPCRPVRGLWAAFLATPQWDNTNWALDLNLRAQLPRGCVPFSAGHFCAGSRNCVKVADRRIRRLRANARFVSRNRDLPLSTGARFMWCYFLPRRAYSWRRGTARRTLGRRRGRKGPDTILKA
jgi:hypothetical protein